MSPDLILSSSAVRARETARLVQEKIQHPDSVTVSDELYAFEPAPFLNALIHLDEKLDSVMLVGHNPAMEEMVAGLTGEFQPLPTATLVRIQLPIDEWGKASFGMHAKVAGIWRPKELQDDR